MKDNAEAVMNDAWTPDSWRNRPIVQVPTYPDAAALSAVEAELRR
ncbi:MAG: 3-deoxy-7-phosphoheptulonate synthase, partial [Rhodospirillales bacterium]|nr:3-deoxy-7-phosphoheptulonate synthase [Rhodospirillales bacterium]